VRAPPINDADNLAAALEELSPEDRLVMLVLRQAVQDISDARHRDGAVRWLLGDGVAFAAYLDLDPALWEAEVERARKTFGGGGVVPASFPAELDRQPIVFRALRCSHCEFVGADQHALAKHWSAAHPRENLDAMEDVVRWVDETDRRRRLHLLAVARGIRRHSAYILLRHARSELKSRKTG
jgi:hypothetical protein